MVYENTVQKYKKQLDDYYIPLPKTIIELQSRLSSKSRHNIRREKNIIIRDYGSMELIDQNISAVDEKTIELFYSYKKISYAVPGSFDIRKTKTTNIYTLKCGDEIKAILLSCEQSNICFLENLTYDPTMPHYSFGQVMYDMYLETLIKKSKKVYHY